MNVKLFVIFLTTLLTVFSILYNYEENETVKLGKWGWTALIATMLLALSNIWVENIESQNKAKRESETDSIRNELIVKNDSLSKLLKTFEKNTSSNLIHINEEIVNNLSSLDKLNSSLTRSMRNLKGTIDNVETNLEESIYASNFEFPDSFETYLWFGIDLGKDEMENLLKDYHPEFPEISELRSEKDNYVGSHTKKDNPEYFYSRELLDLHNVFFDNLEVIIQFKSDSIWWSMLSGKTDAVEYDYTIVPWREDISIEVKMMVHVSSMSYASTIFDVCNGNARILMRINDNNEFYELDKLSLDFFGLELITSTRALLMESPGPGAENELLLISKEGYFMEYMSELNDCWGDNNL